MASPAPWLHRTQTELRRWEGEEEEEEEEEDDLERRMDEDGVIGLGEDAGSPPWGDGEDLKEGSPAEGGRWHPRQDLEEEEEEEEEWGSSRGDEGPWGAESDGDPYPELSYEGRWGSGSSGSPGMSRDGRDLCSTDDGDTSGLSDASPSPAPPSHRHRGWDVAGDTGGGHREGWPLSQSLSLSLSTDDLHDATNTKPIPEPQPAGKGLPAPSTAGLAPTGEPWGAGTPPAPQEGSRVPKKAVPTVLPPKPSHQSWSRSPRQRHRGGKEARDPSGWGTDGPQYGRGQLNHPLPDLSKVEARVKFNQSYRPPRGRVLPAHPRATGGPLGFKSPAEIVREVLLSSGEGVPTQPPTTTPGVPKELRSPRQATQLVQQLQEDYHKLLTKYAEAENTIDQLRLGARVSLYADPPRLSHSFTVGTVGTGCRVMALSIPRASTATVSMATEPPSSPGAAPAPGPPEQGGSPLSPPPPGGGCPTCPGQCCCPGTQLTRTLVGQTHKLQAQVESFEGWIRGGNPTPWEQLQRFRKLKDAQDALEGAYLRARHQHLGTSGDFDRDRVVEGEIFHLGLRLEELKERLELGAGGQPPLNPPDQPPSPPSPSPPPATHSPHPESPTLMEGPQEMAGDSEAVTGGLPRRLWHKQLRVEEDFGDLLAQYKHFKSLPESLSLEQLSLVESGSQEEVDGPAAGDSGPSKVPCGTRSLEEEADLETSPLHPPERRAALLTPKELPWPRGPRGHLSPTTTEDPPAVAKPSLGLPEPPRAPLSQRSSGVATSATQHRPHKEQRIVSPETDSGFVGSEASRVSPPVHTPELRPPSTGTPGSLRPSIPIPVTLRPPRQRDGTPLPSKPALMGIFPTGGGQGGTGGLRLPPSTPLQSSSPPRWAGSGGSEVGPDGDGTHMDLEVEGRSCTSMSGHPPITARGPASPLPSPETPSLTPPSPNPLSLNPAPCDLLGSRLERDQAIRALRDEVWRLRRRLEESLRHSRSYPKGKATPARRQPLATGPSAPKGAAPPGEPSPPARGRGTPRIAPRRQGGSASLPRDRPDLRLDPTDRGHGPSGSHPASLSSPAAHESPPSPAGPPSAPSPQESPPRVGTFRGQHTGTRYQMGAPRAPPAPREEPGAPGCPRCHGNGMTAASSGVTDATRQPQHSTPRRTRCPTCQAPMGAPPSGARDGATRAERDPAGTSPPGSHVGPHAEKPQHPGLWYLAASPGATTAIGCLAPVPLVPYAPSVLYCSSAVPTSAPAMPGVPLQHPMGLRRAEHPPRPHAAAPHRCLMLELEELEDLNQSLSRAVEVAQSMKVTTTRMSRVLGAELSRAWDLRGSCLF